MSRPQASLHLPAAKGPISIGVVALRLVRHHVEPTVQPMFFRARSGGEEQGVDRRIDEAVAKGDAPQAVDRYRLPVRRLELADESAGGQVIGVDPAVAEVADEQAVAELAKPG